jgi:hypothetical protein
LDDAIFYFSVFMGGESQELLSDLTGRGSCGEGVDATKIFVEMVDVKIEQAVVAGFVDEG